MIIYGYKCTEAHRFDAAVPTMDADNPDCPACGSETRRLPGAAGLSGTADPGPSREQMPHSWEAVRKGDPETVAHWRRHAQKREKLEEKYPELGGDRRPVLAHEGAFAGRPLRAGDDAKAVLSKPPTQDP